MHVQDEWLFKTEPGLSADFHPQLTLFQTLYKKQIDTCYLLIYHYNTLFQASDK